MIYLFLAAPLMALMMGTDGKLEHNIIIESSRTAAYTGFLSSVGLILGWKLPEIVLRRKSGTEISCAVLNTFQRFGGKGKFFACSSSSAICSTSEYFPIFAHILHTLARNARPSPGNCKPRTENYLVILVIYTFLDRGNISVEQFI